MLEHKPSRAMLYFLAMFAAAFSQATSQATPPNIVFILADDLGINDLACYGRSDHRTPHLDKLARDGLRFTSAYAAQSVCSPTRAALMTGKHPARLHLTTFLPGRPNAPSQKLLHPKIHQQLPKEEVTVASRLKAAGYATACIGKWHLGGANAQPTDFGFDVAYAGKAVTKPSESEGGKGEYDLTTHAIDFIKANRDRPFFLHLAHNNPHIPFSAQDPRVQANDKAFSPVYAAVIETLDDAVGRLLQSLDELRLSDNTLVVFTSDNGGLHVPEGPHEKVTHNTPFRAGKGFLYEGGIRVPCIARWPGRISPGTQSSQPVISHDWAATLLEVAGAKLPPNLDGVSLVAHLAGKPLASRDLFWHMPHYVNQGGRPAGAIRSGDWKLMEHYEDGTIELFNLASDIGETRNIASEKPELTRELKEKLHAWLKACDAQMNDPNPEFDIKMHRTLYVDIDPSQFAPATANDATWSRMRDWRKAMNAAVAGSANNSKAKNKAKN